jgi:RimJ/RimL family protein N-acetyltransferase
MNGPVIEGKLVRLRPPRIEDAEVMMAWFEDLEVTRFLKATRQARAQAAAGYREVGRWQRDRFVDGEWRDHVLTEVLREDWEKARLGSV